MATNQPTSRPANGATSRPAPLLLFLVFLSPFLFALLLPSRPAQAAEPARSRPRLPTAVLVVGSPLPPSAPVVTVLRSKLGAVYDLDQTPALRNELESLTRERTPEEQVGEALRDANERMRRLALEDVQRILDEAEAYVQQLPPTPGGQSLLGAVALRRAHVALLRGDSTAAENEIERGLSADPELTLDQAQEPPTLVELFERVRATIQAAPPIPLTVVTDPVGATVVLGGVPRGLSPVELSVPAHINLTLWAVKDGYRPRNVTARAEPDDKGNKLTVQLHLDRMVKLQQARPLVDALRGAVPASRAATAGVLSRFLGVDAVLLTQLGPGAHPRIDIYGAAPRWPSPVSGVSGAAGLPGLPGLDADLILPLSPPIKPRPWPAWTWALIGGGIGAVLAGVIVGTAVGTR